MVWRKIILSFILICCILLVAASGSPANAAEEQSIVGFEIASFVPLYVVDYARSIVTSKYVDKDYILFCSSTLDTGEDFFLIIGEVQEDDLDFWVIPEVIYSIGCEYGEITVVSWGYASQFGVDQFFISNPNQFVVYSNIGSNPSIFERGEIYSYATMVLLATCIVCYLLRSVFDFCLRRQS